MDEEKDLNDVSVLANLAANELWKVPVGNFVNAIGNAADTMENLHGLLAAAEKELQEQARLNGMGSEREAALLAKLEMAEKDRDHWKFEYENVCKFATQYEGERDGLEATLGRAREALKKLRQFVEQDYWRQVIDEALSSLPTTDDLECNDMTHRWAGATCNDCGKPTKQKEIVDRLALEEARSAVIEAAKELRLAEKYMTSIAIPGSDISKASERHAKASKEYRLAIDTLVARLSEGRNPK